MFLPPPFRLSSRVDGLIPKVPMDLRLVHARGLPTITDWKDILQDGGWRKWVPSGPPGDPGNGTKSNGDKGGDGRGAIGQGDNTGNKNNGEDGNNPDKASSNGQPSVNNAGDSGSTGLETSSSNTTPPRSSPATSTSHYTEAISSTQDPSITSLSSSTVVPTSDTGSTSSSTPQERHVDTKSTQFDSSSLPKLSLTVLTTSQSGSQTTVTLSSSPSGPGPVINSGIIGGIVSAIVVLVAILVSAFCIWRRRRIHRNDKMVSNYPFAGHGRNHSTPSSIGFNPLAMVRQRSRRSIGTILSSFRRTRRKGVPRDRDDMTSISGFTTYTSTTGVFSSDLACSSLSQDKRAEGRTAKSGGPTSPVDEKSTFDPPPAPFTLTPVRSQYFN